MSSRGRLALLVGAVLALLVPSLAAADPPPSGVVTLAVLSLAVALLVRHGHGCAALAPRTSDALPARGLAAPPARPDRVTDPVHHPLRPRAPGRR